MGRNANTIIQTTFEEFQDDDHPTKCNKVRCIYCGFVRAKNTTRQVEHLQRCLQYQNSSDYVQSPKKPGPPQQPDEDNFRIMFETFNSPIQATPLLAERSSLLMGQRPSPSPKPDPNPLVSCRGPRKRSHDGQMKSSQCPTPHPITTASPGQSLSLATYLLTQNTALFTSATQASFLFHAGRGTLSSDAIGHWLAQESHLTRGYITFVGQLIGKICLPIVANEQSHPLYRAMDLLISALNKIRREMSFFEITAAKYSLQIPEEVPNDTTTSFLGQLTLSSSPNASLLEGMVVLWAVEHCYHASWVYAAGISASLDHPILPYSSSSDSHYAALHQSLIPNWTSATFGKFVDMCKAVVDELANVETSPHGRKQMACCLGAFEQVLRLWEENWQSAYDTGEKNKTMSAGCSISNRVSPCVSNDGFRSYGVPDHAANGNSVDEIRKENTIGDSQYVSPHQIDGLQAVERANNV